MIEKIDIFFYKKPQNNKLNNYYCSNNNNLFIKNWKINFNKKLKKKKYSKDKKYIIKVENLKKLKKTSNFIKKFKKINKLIKKSTKKFKFKPQFKLYSNFKKNKIIKYQTIFNNFFYYLYKKKINILNFNYFFKTKIKKFNLIVKKILSKNSFLKKTVITYKILKILLASLIYKDSNLLIIVIKNLFENIHYSKHRVYFNFWSFLIKSFLINNLKKLNVFGVKLEFHGKLGVGGNSKKRSVYYHIGRCSNSSKIFKIDSTHSYFRTATGVVGFTYSIFY